MGFQTLEVVGQIQPSCQRCQDAMQNCDVIETVRLCGKPLPGDANLVFVIEHQPHSNW